MVELLLGLVLSAAVALATASLFRVMLVAARATARQIGALRDQRVGLSGDEGLLGAVPSVRAATGVIDLSSSTLAVMPPASSSIQFFVDGGTLAYSQLGSTTAVIAQVLQFSVSYYALDQNGLIMASTSPFNVGLATIMLQQKGKRDERVYKAYSGAALRNLP